MKDGHIAQVSRQWPCFFLLNYGYFDPDLICIPLIFFVSLKRYTRPSAIGYEMTIAKFEAERTPRVSSTLRHCSIRTCRRVETK